MKRACFLKFEGFLENEKNYVVDVVGAKNFLKKFLDFCLKNNIEVFLISGFNKKIAFEKFDNSFVKDFFDKKNFFVVDEEYISLKQKTDQELYKKNLEKDSFFVDSFFKQTVISKIIFEKKLNMSDCVLLCNDVWVDGYYTTRFSKIDFFIFENNIQDRGEKIEKIPGLIYFNFSNVIDFFEKEIIVDYSFLDKYVFERMKEVLMKDVDLSSLKKKLGGIQNG